MAILPIIKYPSPVLRRKAEAVPQNEIAEYQQLVFDMFDTMEHGDGIGLAAPQVGINRQIIVIDVGSVSIALFNPIVTDAEGPTEIFTEGCLSFSSRLLVDVTRPKEYVLHYYNSLGQPCRLVVGGLIGRVILHEIDHLNGKLLIDYLPFWQRMKYRLTGGQP